MGFDMDGVASQWLGPLVPLRICCKQLKRKARVGGADGIRTHDLLDAIEARSQLRHGPTEGLPKFITAGERQSFRVFQTLSFSFGDAVASPP
jgi:hypothetical protein